MLTTTRFYAIAYPRVKKGITEITHTLLLFENFTRR